MFKYLVYEHSHTPSVRLLVRLSNQTPTPVARRRTGSRPPGQRIAVRDYGVEIFIVCTSLLIFVIRAVTQLGYVDPTEQILPNRKYQMELGPLYF